MRFAPRVLMSEPALPAAGRSPRTRHDGKLAAAGWLTRQGRECPCSSSRSDQGSVKSRPRPQACQARTVSSDPDAAIGSGDGQKPRLGPSAPAARLSSATDAPTSPVGLAASCTSKPPILVGALVECLSVGGHSGESQRPRVSPSLGAHSCRSRVCRLASRLVAPKRSPIRLRASPLKSARARSADSPCGEQRKFHTQASQVTLVEPAATVRRRGRPRTPRNAQRHRVARFRRLPRLPLGRRSA